MKRTKLIQARVTRGWSQEQAAEEIGVSRGSLSQWERGVKDPYPANVLRLCTVYGTSVEELDLQAVSQHVVQSMPVSGPDLLEHLLQSDLAHQLLQVVFSWPSTNIRYHELQALITQMTQERKSTHINRREALRRLALLPIELHGLSALSTLRTRSTEEILAHCAAGIIACEQISNGPDLAIAYAVVCAYLPTLTLFVRESPRHRKPAARLVTQCLFLKTILGMHLEGYQQALRSAQEAVQYSEESGDFSMRITALGRLAWVHSCGRQKGLTLDCSLEAQHILTIQRPSSPALHSYVHGVSAKYLALNGRKDEALQSLAQAHTHFFKDDSQTYSYIDHDLSNFLLDDGTTYGYLGMYDQALASFAQIINPGDLTAKIPVADRIRGEVLNCQAVASLKLRNKDQEQTLRYWQAGLQTAIDLKSEQRFHEVINAYDMMEAVWSDEPAIRNVRELLVHW